MPHFEEDQTCDFCGGTTNVTASYYDENRCPDCYPVATTSITELEAYEAEFTTP